MTTASKNVEYLTAKETEVPEELQGFRDDLIRQHVSFLSPCYLDKTWKPFTEAEIVEAQQELANRNEYDRKEGIYYKNKKMVIPEELVTHVILGLHISRGLPSSIEERAQLKKFHFEGLKKSDAKVPTLL
eukprot:snap_masked-scaffold_29-processed-gene-0.37-mRNA-1 protein AED:1.00 eAED:1.00 QI:0/0/0/0/1/1/2/0/129